MALDPLNSSSLEQLALKGLNWFLQTGYRFCCRNGFNIPWRDLKDTLASVICTILIYKTAALLDSNDWETIKVLNNRATKVVSQADQTITSKQISPALSSKYNTSQQDVRYKCHYCTRKPYKTQNQQRSRYFSTTNSSVLLSD